MTAVRSALAAAFLLAPTLLVTWLAMSPVARERESPPAPAPAVAVWVTRWDYGRPADVRRIVQDVANLGATDLLWQVRGRFDAFYPSELEPWAEELKPAADAPEPDFDPLALAIDEAHAHGLRLHAWVNVFPMWEGRMPPTDPRHPLRRHPGWLLHDQHGHPQPLSDHYVVANPADPEVQRHIRAVCRDIARRYAVDGLHLDYVRFVSENLGAELLYPGDPPSLARFAHERGVGAPSLEDRGALRAWLRDEITALVRGIAADLRSERRGALMSAAVWRRPDLALDEVLQDAASWLREGTLDRVMPMIYTTDTPTFSADLEAWLAVADAARLWPGIGLQKDGGEETLTERLAFARRALGVSLFAYHHIFESVSRIQDDTAEARSTRAAWRSLLSSPSGIAHELAARAVSERESSTSWSSATSAGLTR